MGFSNTIKVVVALAGLGLCAPDAARATDLRAHEHVGARYDYQTQTRGYYPYYNSGYWRPATELKGRHHYHFTLPKYYAYWGGPKHTWDNRAWHDEHHGRHLPWHY